MHRRGRTPTPQRLICSFGAECALRARPRRVRAQAAVASNKCRLLGGRLGPLRRPLGALAGLGGRRPRAAALFAHGWPNPKGWGTIVGCAQQIMHALLVRTRAGGGRALRACRDAGGGAPGYRRAALRECLATAFLLDAPNPTNQNLLDGSARGGPVGRAAAHTNVRGTHALHGASRPPPTEIVSTSEDATAPRLLGSFALPLPDSPRFPRIAFCRGPVRSDVVTCVSRRVRWLRNIGSAESGVRGWH